MRLPDPDPHTVPVNREGGAITNFGSGALSGPDPNQTTLSWVNVHSTVYTSQQLDTGVKEYLHFSTNLRTYIFFSTLQKLQDCAIT
jgi:hypothetical protein